MQNDVVLKERLVYRRNALNLTQAELASRAGLSERSVSDWERGLSKPSMDKLRKLAQALNVPWAYLLGEESMEEMSVLREKTRTDVAGYSKLETEVLERILSDLSGTLSQFSRFERKKVIGNLRAILDELEERLLQGEPSRTTIAARTPISSKPPSADEERAFSGAAAAQRLAQESASEQSIESPTGSKSGPGAGKRGHRG